jgi:hypothetical protein
MPLDNDRAAKYVGGGGGEAEENASGNGMHLLRENISFS